MLAARKLGLTEAPVIVLAHLSPTQRRALMIADNQIANQAGGNEEVLAAELAALRDEDVDLGFLGFAESELDRLLTGEVEKAEQLDEAPEPPTDPVARAGDLWICGQHQRHTPTKEKRWPRVKDYASQRSKSEAMLIRV